MHALKLCVQSLCKLKSEGMLTYILQPEPLFGKASSDESSSLLRELRSEGMPKQVKQLTSL